MGTSVTLFKVFDIEVRIHWSFVLILVYGAFYSTGASNPLIGALYGILLILLLFVCVTLHEFGHALVAKRFKINVPHITLLPIGGVASLERMPDKPLQEFFIAIAGPLVNFVIAGALFSLLLLFGNLPNSFNFYTFQRMMSQMQAPGLTNLLTYLVVTNVGLGIFNLLPAFPMDGGRVLRSLLALGISYVDATRVAVFVGRLMAALFALWGIVDVNVFMLLIAFFIYVGGGSEREAVESKAVLRNILAEQALAYNAVNLYTSERVDRAVDLIMNSYQTDYPVLDLSGRFAGVLTRARLIYALKEIGPEARIVDVMLKAQEIPVCAPNQDLAVVWELMATGGSRVVAVKRGQEFLGLLTLDDITEVFQVYGAKLAGPGRAAATTTVYHPKPEGVDA